MSFGTKESQVSSTSGCLPLSQFAISKRAAALLTKSQNSLLDFADRLISHDRLVPFVQPSSFSESEQTGKCDCQSKLS